MGGLGVGDIVMKNAVLLFKRWWRFSTEKNSLWKQIICSRNNMEINRPVNELNSAFGLGPWSDISRIGLKNPELKGIVSNGIQLSVGNGLQIYF